MRLYLNPRVVFKSKPTFSCIYNNSTGWYYQCSHDFWRTLQTYKRGREVDERSMPPAFQELLKNLFLIKTRRLNPKDLYTFHPMRAPETVYYQYGDKVDVALERIGAHGEIDFDVAALEGEAAGLWRASDGLKTLGEVIKELTIDVNKALKDMGSWVSIENQLVRLLSTPLPGFQEPPPQLVYKAPFLPQKTVARPWAEDVHRYHLDTIKDGAEQFERIESTLSHLYRVPHPILRGQSYGQALYSKLKEEKPFETGMKILEVGGGAGSISADMLERIKQEGKSVEYIIYDLSPALIKAQRELHNERGVKALHLNGNGESLALKDKSVDIAFSNEAIADFNTPEVPREEVKGLLFDHGIPAAPEFFNHYVEGPGKVRVNLGAFQLLKELFRVLRPEGLAVVTEFGYQDRLPFRAAHLDHAEYSIQFNQLASVAKAIGFNLYLTDAWDFLGFQENVELMTHYSYQAVLRILESHNTHLPNITYTEGLFKGQLKERAKGFKGLRFVPPVKEPFKIVKVLVCRKPLDFQKEL